MKKSVSDRIAKSLLKKWNSNIDLRSFQNDFFEIISDHNKILKGASDTDLYKLAQSLIKGVKTSDVAEGTYKSVINELKKGISLNRNQMVAINGEYGNVGRVVENYKGKVKLLTDQDSKVVKKTKADTQTLTELWSKWNSEYGDELFPADTAEDKMLTKVLEFVDKAYAETNPHSENMNEAIHDVIDEIVFEFENAQKYNTFADKQSKIIDGYRKDNIDLTKKYDDLKNLSEKEIEELNDRVKKAEGELKSNFEFKISQQSVDNITSRLLENFSDGRFKGVTNFREDVKKAFEDYSLFAIETMRGIEKKTEQKLVRTILTSYDYYNKYFGGLAEKLVRNGGYLEDGHTLESAKEEVITEIMYMHQNARKVSTFADRADARLAKYKEQVATSKEKARNRRKVSQLRSNIKKLALEFGQRVANPRGAKVVPTGMITQVAEIASMINLDTGRPGMYGGVSAFNQKLSDLKTKYDNLKNDVDYQEAYDESLSEYIGILQERLAKRAIKDIDDIETLQDVYNILSAIRHTIINANQQLDMDQRITNAEMSESIVKDVAVAGKRKFIKQKSALERMLTSPEFLVDYIVGFNPDSKLNHLTQELIKGARKRNYVYMKMMKPFEEWIDKNGVDAFEAMDEITRDFGIKVVEGDVNTGTVNTYDMEITPTMAMAIILSYEREKVNKNLKHIKEGGIKVPDTEKMRKGKHKVAVSGSKYQSGIDNAKRIANSINDAFVNSLYSKLTKGEKEVLEIIKKVCREEAGTYMNETSMILKGYKVATEQNYFPIVIDGADRNKEIVDGNVDKLLENSGAVQSLQANAINPIMAVSAISTCTKHMSFVASYNGVAVPLRNFRKVWERGSRDKNGVETSARAMIKKVYGEKVATSIEDMLRTMNGNDVLYKNSDLSKSFDKFTSMYAGAKVVGNLSTLMKVGLSGTMVKAYVSDAAFWTGKAKAMQRYAKPGFMKNLYKEIEEHTAANWLRRTGVNVEERGQQQSLAESKHKNIGNSLSVMDGRGTALAWECCKAQAKKDGFKEGSEEFWDRTTEIYDTFVEQSQSSNDAMFRSELFNDKHPVVRTLILFKTEVFKGGSLLVDKMGRWQYQHNVYKTNKTESNKRKLQNARAEALRSTEGLLYTSIAMALATALKNVIMFSPYGLKDEEEEINQWTVAVHVAQDVMYGLLDYAPFAGDLAKAALGYIGKATDTEFLKQDDFDENLVPIALFDDVNKTWSEIKKILDSENKSNEEKFHEVFAASTEFLLGMHWSGNVERLINGVVRHVKSIFGKGFTDPTEYFKTEFDLSDTVVSFVTGAENESAMFEQTAKGDKTLINEYMNRYQKEHPDKDIDDARSYVRQKFTREYKEQYQKAFWENDQTKMKEIAQILINSNLYTYKIKVDKKSGGFYLKSYNIADTLAEWRKKAKEDLEE